MAIVNHQFQWLICKQQAFKKSIMWMANLIKILCFGLLISIKFVE